MFSGAHSIRSLSLEVNRTGETNGLALLEEASSWANEILLPQIEEVFASFPDSQEVIRIDRLELELSSSSENDWGHEILPQLKSELSAMLAKISADRTPRKTQENLGPQGSFFRHLVYFLREGILPWSSPIRSRDEWDEAVTDWLSSIDAAEYKAQFVELLVQPAVRLRFVHSVSIRTLQKTMAVFFGVPERTWMEWVEDARRLQWTREQALSTSTSSTTELPVEERVIHSLTEDLFEAIPTHAFSYDGSLEVEVITRVLARMMREQHIDPRFESLEFASAAFSEARKVISLGLPSARRYSTEAASLDTDAREAVDFSLREVDATSDIETTPGVQATERRSQAVPLRPQSSKPAAEGIYVSNAGTVLVAPFLMTFFDRVGVAKDRQLTEPELAIALIQYVATGQEKAAEFELALPKLLCGWELEQPIELPDRLPEQMKDEANRLLAAMIEHWSILKNTSPEGLRESFLKRQGKVTLTERDEWLLQVEQKSFDMLLQQLPWGFQLTKLPWMNRLLRTEWVY